MVSWVGDCVSFKIVHPTLPSYVAYVVYVASIRCQTIRKRIIMGSLGDTLCLWLYFPWLIPQLPLPWLLNWQWSTFSGLNFIATSSTTNTAIYTLREDNWEQRHLNNSAWLRDVHRKVNTIQMVGVIMQWKPPNLLFFNVSQPSSPYKKGSYCNCSGYSSCFECCWPNIVLTWLLAL